MAALLLCPCKAAWTAREFAQNRFFPPQLNIAIVEIFDDSCPDRTVSFVKDLSMRDCRQSESSL